MYLYYVILVYFSLVVMFHVLSVVKDTHTYKKGTDVVAILKKKLKASSEVLDFQVALVDTVGEYV